MNKKIKNLFLAGALVLGLAGVSVSCTDYSKDIDEVRAENASLSDEVAKLKAAIEAGSVVTKVEKTDAGLKFTLSDGSSYEVTNGTDGKDGADGTDGADGKAGADGQTPAIKDGYWYIGDTNTGVKAEGEDGKAGADGKTPYIKDGYWYIGDTNTGVKAKGEDGKDGVYYVPDVESGKWKKCSTENPEGVLTDISYLPSGTVAATIVDGKLTITVDGEEITSFLLKATLTSLVFEPELYVNGAAANEYTYVKFEKKLGKASTSTDVSYSGITWKLPAKAADAAGWWDYQTAVADKDVYINPVDTVLYHVNPSNANLTNAKYSFLSSTKECITRGIAASGSAFEASLLDYKDGILAVGIKGSGKDIATSSDELTVFALRATVGKNGKDTTVTSDYAGLYASTLAFSDLGYTSDEYVGNSNTIHSSSFDNHLYTTAKDAINAVPSVKISFNDEEGVNLSEAVTAHISITSNSSRSVTVADYAEVFPNNDYRVKYDFSLIDYTRNLETTSESSYAVLEESDGDIYLKPNNNLTSVGRCPLVRVTLNDEDGNIILVGFIKAEIIVSAVTPAVADWTANFGTADFVGTATEAEMKNAIDATGLSAAAFADNYKLYVENTSYDDHDGSTHSGEQAVQYYKGSDGNFISVTTSAGIHKGMIENVSLPGVNYKGLRWTLTPGELDRIHWSKEDHKDTVYVRYLPVASSEESKGFYVPMTIKVVKPTATVGTKIDNFWYADGVRLNVTVPDASSGSSSVLAPNWITDLDDFWVGNRPTFNIYSPATEFTGAAANYKYYFAPVQPEFFINGVKYTLSVANNKVSLKYYALSSVTPITDNSKIAEYELDAALDVTAANSIYVNDALFCSNGGAPVKIASLNQGTGEVKYENNEMSRLLLNSEDTLYANIGVAAYNLDNVAVSLTENAINRYNFLRPININIISNNPESTSTADKYFVDGGDVTSDKSNIKIFDLFEFTDWRGEKFMKASDDFTNLWYFKYYGMTGVKVDANITTTLKIGGTPGKLGETLLSAVTDKIGFKLFNGTFAEQNPISFVFSSTAQLPWGVTQYDSTVKAYGYLHYENNGFNLSEGFKIRVPVTFSYVWGEITKTVDIEIKSR